MASKAHESIKNDPSFWKEFESHYSFIGRPSHLQLAERLTAYAGNFFFVSSRALLLLFCSDALNILFSSSFYSYFSSFSSSSFYSSSSFFFFSSFSFFERRCQNLVEERGPKSHWSS